MKNMNWKKGLSLFLALLMLVGMVPVSALAAGSAGGKTPWLVGGKTAESGENV